VPNRGLTADRAPYLEAPQAVGPCLCNSVASSWSNSRTVRRGAGWRYSASLLEILDHSPDTNSGRCASSGTTHAITSTKGIRRDAFLQIKL